MSKLVTSKSDDTIFVLEKMPDLSHDFLSIGECDSCLVVFGGRCKFGTLYKGGIPHTFGPSLKPGTDRTGPD